MARDLTEYIIDCLRRDGYTGVAGEECGCSLEDFPACGEFWGTCAPGYRHAPPPCLGWEEWDECWCEGIGECEECFRTERPPRPPAVSKTGAV